MEFNEPYEVFSFLACLFISDTLSHYNIFVNVHKLQDILGFEFSLVIALVVE